MGAANRETVAGLLADAARAAPEAPAIVYEDAAGTHTISYAAMLDQSSRAAQGLADLGIGAGDRVALWLPNVPAWPILYLACCRLGAIRSEERRVGKECRL